MSTSAEGVPEPGPQFTPPHEPPLDPRFTPPDRVAPEDASLLWPEAHLLSEPPPGYRPLEMPAPWDPEPAAANPPPSLPHPEPTPKRWKYAPYAPTSAQPVESAPTAPREPAPGYVISAPYEGAPAQPARDAAARPPALRSFRDLRTGPLEGREFSSMKDFAVAAVLEAGHAEADVARLFRFAPWQLRAWVDEARGASFGPGRRPDPA